MSSSISYGFPGIVTLLTCIFAVAKLWGKIDWSWWWVLSPIWISLGIVLLVIIVIFIIMIIGALIE